MFWKTWLTVTILLVKFHFQDAKITCNSRIDYTKSSEGCPVYDVENCDTPNVPPACPIAEITNRYPCLRYTCRDDDLKDTHLKKGSEVKRSRDAKTTGAPFETTRIDLEKIVTYLKSEFSTPLVETSTTTTEMPTTLDNFLLKRLSEKAGHDEFGMVLFVFIGLIFIVFALGFCCVYCLKYTCNSICHFDENQPPPYDLQEINQNRNRPPTDGPGTSENASRNTVQASAPFMDNVEIDMEENVIYPPSLNASDVNVETASISPNSVNSLARGACNCPPGPSNRPCCSFPDADVNPDVDNQNEQQSDAQKSIKKKRKSSMSKDYAYRPNCSIEIPEVRRRSNRIDIDKRKKKGY